jgi:hypothetical protein
MKRSRQVTVLGALLISGAILLGGCGGSGGGKRLTKAEYAAKANALCADLNKASKALGNPTSTAEVTAGLDKLLPVERNLVAKLKKLNPPANEEATAKKAVAAVDQLTTSEEQLNALLKKGDMAKAQKLIATLNGPGSKVNALFKQLGATECAK